MEVNVVDREQGRQPELLGRHLEALYGVCAALNTGRELSDILADVMAVLHDHAAMRRGLVAVADAEGSELLLGVAHEGDDSRGRPVRYRRGEGILGTVLAEGRSLVVPRLAREPRFLDRLKRFDSGAPLVGVPIQAADGETLGVLAAQPEGEDHLPEQARLLEMVAHLLAERVRLLRHTEGERRRLADERDALRREVRQEYGFDNIVGHTEPMRRIFELVRQVAKWDTTVLIRGESGTGKELIAHAIHYNSPRSSGPFVKLNCAALPDNLLESELFGHEKGAFTGALSTRKGRFELGDGGTMFLDEIGEVSPAFQAKLLRILAEGEFERVGGSRTLKVDVRIIAATNRPLEQEIEEGRFREDLYYRLNVLPIQMPALRERKEDIPDLVRFMAKRIGAKQGRTLDVTESALRLLVRHDWPGNVRELENTVERAAIMTDSGVIDRDVVVDAGLTEGFEAPAAPGTAPGPAPLPADLDDPDLDERERVIAALEQAGWVQAKAARLLGMTPRQVAYRIRMLNIKVRRM